MLLLVAIKKSSVQSMKFTRHLISNSSLAVLKGLQFVVTTSYTCAVTLSWGMSNSPSFPVQYLLI